MKCVVTIGVEISIDESTKKTGPLGVGVGVGDSVGDRDGNGVGEVVAVAAGEENEIEKERNNANKRIPIAWLIPIILQCQFIDS
jgi:hypothetical protein